MNITVENFISLSNLNHRKRNLKNGENGQNSLINFDFRVKLPLYSFYLFSSIILIKKYESVLIAPIFLLSLFTLKKFFLKVDESSRGIYNTESHESKGSNESNSTFNNDFTHLNTHLNAECYFCLQRERYEKNKIKYSIYKELINENVNKVI